MPVQYTCPECKTILQRSEPLPAGKKIKCPKCESIFAPKAPSGKPVVNPAVAKAIAKPAAPKATVINPALKDMDDDRNPYALAAENEETDRLVAEEKKRAAEGVVKDRFKKSARGPAARAVVQPANALLAIGVLSAIGHLISVVVAIFPLIFEINESGTPAEGQKYSDVDKKKKNQISPEEWRQMLIIRIPWAIGSVIGFCISGLIVNGAFHLRSLDSRGWAWTGAILAILFGTLFGMLIGIWCVTVLNSEKVKAGFEEEKPPEV